MLLSQQYADHVPFAEISAILNLGVFSGSELPLLQGVLPEDGAMICVDPFGSEKLHDFVARDTAGDDRIDIVQAAIAGRQGTRSFQNLGGATTAVMKETPASFQVPAVTLRQILDRRPELYTNLLIKTDIEGAEIGILDDLIAVANQNRAALAISVYHSREQFTLIPNRLIDELEGYRYHFKRYRPFPAEAIFYAIPRELTQVNATHPYKRVWPEDMARSIQD